MASTRRQTYVIQGINAISLWIGEEGKHRCDEMDAGEDFLSRAEGLAGCT
ncbi:hypothetical protein [Hydrogenophaga crassostreae]|nr:hypothetical protein [Hydrogenophaga crassostreae]